LAKVVEAVFLSMHNWYKFVLTGSHYTLENKLYFVAGHLWIATSVITMIAFLATWNRAWLTVATVLVSVALARVRKFHETFSKPYDQVATSSLSTEKRKELEKVKEDLFKMVGK
jgi:hypothetical protein